jgi:hypothetical protein
VTCYTQPCKPCKVKYVLDCLPQGDESSPRGGWGICAPALPEVLTATGAAILQDPFSDNHEGPSDEEFTCYISEDDGDLNEGMGDGAYGVLDLSWSCKEAPPDIWYADDADGQDDPDPSIDAETLQEIKNMLGMDWDPNRCICSIARCEEVSYSSLPPRRVLPRRAMMNDFHSVFKLLLKISFQPCLLYAIGLHFPFFYNVDNGFQLRLVL